MSVLLLFVSQMALAMNANPIPFPVFLKFGFSSILEFEEAPSQVVLGDPSVFQIEKLNKSIVIKPLAAYATTNMFVYFKAKDTRLFILTASEEAQPTYFKKFSTLVPPVKPAKPTAVISKFIRGTKVIESSFDKQKDFLTIDFEISADSSSKLVPKWDEIRLRYKDRYIKASKLWSERREVQRDSKIKARLIFTKPNIPANMKDVFIVIPLVDSGKSLTLNLKRSP